MQSRVDLRSVERLEATRDKNLTSEETWARAAYAPKSDTVQFKGIVQLFVNYICMWNTES